MLTATFTTPNGPKKINVAEISDFVPFMGGTDINLINGTKIKTLNRFHRSARDKYGNRTILSVRRLLRGEKSYSARTNSTDP